MMFELDETLENKVETPRSRSRSVNSTTPNRRSFTNASPSASGLADILVHTMTDGFGGNASACTSNGNDSDSGNADSGAASLKQSNVPNPLAITSEMLATVGGYQSLMWTCGSHTKIGPRDKNEDRFVVIPNVSPTTVPGIVNIEIVGDHHSVNSTHLNGISKRRGSRILAPTSTGYFAVFDGHCGYQAAAYLAENLLDNISRY